MKYKIVTLVANGQELKTRKSFSTRNSAIEHAFNEFAKRGLYNIYVVDEFKQEKHDVEYVCNNISRFRIVRA